MRWCCRRGAGGRRLAGLAALILMLLLGVPAGAAEPSAAPQQDMMNSAGWLERLTVRLEGEARSDVSMLPDTGSAVEREWRSLDREGSALGALIDVGWVILAALVAIGAERAVARGLSRRVRRALRMRPLGPGLSALLLLLGADMAGGGVF